MHKRGKRLKMEKFTRLMEYFSLEIYKYAHFYPPTTTWAIRTVATLQLKPLSM